MQEAEDEPLFADRAAGIDIAKAGIEVTIRVPSDTRRGGRQQETRSFRTTRKDLLALADWLRCWGVTKIGMESTGDYWKPVYFLLEREGLDCVLYHAAQVKALPGRPKADPVNRTSWRSRRSQARVIASPEAADLSRALLSRPQGRAGRMRDYRKRIYGPIPPICLLLAAACQPPPSTDLPPLDVP